jgi:hypothetical protein
MTVPHENELRQVGVRIPASLYHRMSMHKAIYRVSFQDQVTVALTQYLDRADKIAAKGKT